MVIDCQNVYRLLRVYVWSCKMYQLSNCILLLVWWWYSITSIVALHVEFWVEKGHKHAYKLCMHMKYFVYIQNSTYGSTKHFRYDHLCILLPLLCRLKDTREVLSSQKICHQACSVLTWKITAVGNNTALWQIVSFSYTVFSTFLSVHEKISKRHRSSQSEAEIALCSWKVWTARLERECGRNTEQESILKMLFLFTKRMDLPLRTNSFFHDIHTAGVLVPSAVCVLFKVPCKVNFHVVLQWALYKYFIRGT